MRKAVRCYGVVAVAIFSCLMFLTAIPAESNAAEKNFTLYFKAISQIGTIKNLDQQDVWLVCRDGDDDGSSKIVQITNETLNLLQTFTMPSTCFPEYNPDPPNTFKFYVEKSPGFFNIHKICGGTEISLDHKVGVQFEEAQSGKGVTCTIQPF